MVYDERRLIGELRRQWLYVALIYVSVLGLGYWVLWRAWSTADALQWLLLATLAMMVQMIVLWWALRFNHPPEGAALFPTLGVANGMTLTRAAHLLDGRLSVCTVAAGVAGVGAGPPVYERARHRFF